MDDKAEQEVNVHSKWEERRYWSLVIDEVKVEAVKEPDAVIWKNKPEWPQDPK